MGKIAAAHAAREAEVILNPRACSRLPACRLPLDQYRAQAFRRAVNRCRQPRRSAPHNRQIVERLRRLRLQPHFLRHLRVRRVHQRRPVIANHDRQLYVLDIPQQFFCFRVGFHVHPLVRHAIPRQKVLDPVRIRRPLVPDYPQPLERRAVLFLPLVQQFLHARVQVFFRRVPRLHQVIVQLHLVNRLDRRVCVGVCRQQRAPRVRE